MEVLKTAQKNKLQTEIKRRYQEKIAAQAIHKEKQYETYKKKEKVDR